jgi:FkbM family methyltransferase
MLLDIYRRSRVLVKQAMLIEPRVPVEVRPELEFHGNDYCGWCIPRGALGRDSVVVDVGLGEDVAFSTSLIERYGLTVHGFDPTPRAIEYVRGLQLRQFAVHELGVAGASGRATFYLPNNPAHVSGSLVKESHVGATQISVEVISLAQVFERIAAPRIHLLKLDIEGAEYDLIAARDFARCAADVDMICIEFHHRWPSYGRKATLEAVATLQRCGFRCAWRSGATNEDFLFVNERARAGQRNGE